VALINNRDGFCFVGCVCGLGGVYVGCMWGVVGAKNLCCARHGYLKN